MLEQCCHDVTGSVPFGRSWEREQEVAVNEFRRILEENLGC